MIVVTNNLFVNKFIRLAYSFDQILNMYHCYTISYIIKSSLKGQCIGIEAVQMLVNITSLQTMYDDVFCA